MVLTCMLSSENAKIREKAVKIVLKSRKNPSLKPCAKLFQRIRKFGIPPLNWKAERWDEIIDIKIEKVYEPFVLQKMSDKDISSALKEPLVFPSYPLHSQSVERAVKLVTSAAKSVCGDKN